MADEKRDGIKVTDQGEVYVYITGGTLPSGTQEIPGTNIFPQAKIVTADGAICVRQA